MPDVVPLLEQINTQPGTQLRIRHMSFSRPLSIRPNKRHCFQLARPAMCPHYPTSGISTPQPDVIIWFARLLIAFLFWKTHTDLLHWWPYADWSCWARSSHYSRLIRKILVCQRAKINLTNIQRPSTFVISRGLVVWGMSDTIAKVKEKLLHLTLPTTKKDAQCLVGLFRFWR